MVANQCYVTENEVFFCFEKANFPFFQGTFFFALYFLHVILDNNLI